MGRDHPTGIHATVLGRDGERFGLEGKSSKWQHLNPEKEARITVKVLECTAPKRLVLSWADPDKLKDISRVTFELEPIKELVCLTVTHDKLKAGSKMLRGVSRGWPLVLSSMKSFLETGKAIDVWCAKKEAAA